MSRMQSCSTASSASRLKRGSSRMAARHRGLIVAGAGIALLLGATHLAYLPTVPLGVDAPPTVFSAGRAAAILRDLVGNGLPHPIGSSAGARLRDAIVERLSALGYRSQFQSGWVCDEGACGNPVNIVARLGGDAEDRSTILLVAHYDSVPAGPGASDDGAAVASMLEIARTLSARPAPRHPIVLLFTDGEEAGLLGASLFVREHPLSDHVRAAVNMEARGTSGPSLMFETGTANTWLMHMYRSAIARPLTNSLYYVVYKLLPNDTDFTVFKAAGYQGFNFAYIGNVGRYHTPLDNAANADASSIQHQGDNALAALSALANAPILDPNPGESVFFDGFSRTLIAWPAVFTLPAALLTLLLLLAECAVLLRTRAVTWRRALWGWVATGCTLCVGVALCSGLLALAIRLHKVPSLEGSSWVSQPLPMHITAAAMCMGRGCDTQDDPSSDGTLWSRIANASNPEHSATPTQSVHPVATQPHRARRQVTALVRSRTAHSASNRSSVSSAAGRVNAAGQAMIVCEKPSKNTDSPGLGSKVGAFASAKSAADALSPCC